MKIRKDMIDKLVKEVVLEQLQRNAGPMNPPKINAGSSSMDDRTKRNKEAQDKRAKMKATARGMNEETEALEEDCSCKDKEEDGGAFQGLQPIKITTDEIVEMVKEAVQVVKEANDFSAKRQIIFAAQSASMDFEKEIVKGLDLVDPDQMNNPKLQAQYLSVVKEMERGVVHAVAKAIKQLIAFPRNNGSVSSEAAPAVPSPVPATE